MHASLAPSQWVRRWAPLIPPGEVLDLACGGGRHARLLAELGHAVLALDRDAKALASLQGMPNVRTLCADLEDGSPWPLPGRRFAGIVVANYLYRPLFPTFTGSLGPGGVLIYETFAQGNESFGRPSNPAFLLRPGELLHAFGAELAVVAFEQGRTLQPKPAVVQRLCARRGDAAEALLQP
ncbi:MAG: methyltransferase domain-containing protein [Betaproteobacteria bacterium]|nr:methyltransferase domain-containing protein [Betaproteobacteria bacterium]